MLSTGELAPHLDCVALANLLRRRVAGEPFPHSFIHEADAYSAAPAELVRDRDHAPGDDHAWYFCSPANCHESAGGGSTRRRRRDVRGGSGGERWHPEAGKKPILGPDKKSVGAYRRMLSYLLKIKNPAGMATSFTKKRLGWCMVEVGLEQQDGGANQLVLCKVYRSPHTDPEASREAISAGAGDVVPAVICGVSDGGAIPDESLYVPGGCDMPAPPPASCDYNLHSPGPGVAGKSALPIGPAPKHGIFCRPGGDIPSMSRVAIVKKADAAAVARDGEKAAAVAVVMKFGRSSMPSAERMKEMAKLVLSFPAAAGQILAVVLSEMGNTTNNILLAAWKALTCSGQTVSEIHEFAIIKGLYLRTIDELGLDRSIVSGPLDKLEHRLQHIAITEELTPRTRDYLVSFGARTSTEMFSEYLNKLGKCTRQEWELRAVTTSGRGSTDLTATTIGRALGSTEIQVWKDVDGMFTCDPKVCANAIPVPYLTFDEATELSYFGEQSMQLAMEGGISIIVKNSYNPQAPCTVITKTRDMSKSILLTSIVLKSNITMLDIENTRTLGQYAFVAKAFSIFEDLDIPIDCVATSEGKMSFALVPSKLLSGELIQLELVNVVEKLQEIATVGLHHRSIISLIGNTQMSSILEMALNVLRSSNFVVENVLQGSSKVTKVSLVVHDNVAKHCVQVLHSAFFENGFVTEVKGTKNECAVLVNSSAASSFGVKRNAEAPPCWGQEWGLRFSDVPCPSHKFQRGSGFWTLEENKVFEEAQAAIGADEPNRWECIALMLPRKTVFDVLNHYSALWNDVGFIEAGLIPFPNYDSSVRGLELATSSHQDSLKM